MKILVDEIPRDAKDCPYSAIKVQKDGENWHICKWHNIIAGKKNEIICNCDRWKGTCKYFKENRR